MGDIRHAQRQLHRSDIRRMDDNFARGERAFFTMRIIDGCRANLQRRARIEGFVEPDLSAFQGHGRGHDFENRPQFIDAHGHGVEMARQGVADGRLMSKSGKRPVREFHHWSRPSKWHPHLGRKFANRRRQAFAHRMLNADVEGRCKYG